MQKINLQLKESYKGLFSNAIICKYEITSILGEKLFLASGF
jgi:hypothetical protein